MSWPTSTTTSAVGRHIVDGDLLAISRSPFDNELSTHACRVKVHPTRLTPVTTFDPLGYGSLSADNDGDVVLTLCPDSTAMRVGFASKAPHYNLCYHTGKTAMCSTLEARLGLWLLPQVAKEVVPHHLWAEHGSGTETGTWGDLLALAFRDLPAAPRVALEERHLLTWPRLLFAFGARRASISLLVRLHALGDLAAVYKAPALGLVDLFPSRPMAKARRALGEALEEATRLVEDPEGAIYEVMLAASRCRSIERLGDAADCLKRRRLDDARDLLLRPEENRLERASIIDMDIAAKIKTTPGVLSS